MFCHSASVPEKAIKMLSHAGFSISLTAIHQAIDSLSEEASARLKESVQTLTTSFAYNNFDMAFKVANPMVKNESTFISATSATSLPLYGVLSRLGMGKGSWVWNLAGTELCGNGVTGCRRY
jgi:hypothetical protein